MRSSRRPRQLCLAFKNTNPTVTGVPILVSLMFYVVLWQWHDITRSSSNHKKSSFSKTAGEAFFRAVAVKNDSEAPGGTWAAEDDLA
jgi:hypothetical protein